MPYIITEHKGRYVVRKKYSYKLIGTHDTKEKAEAQIAAIEAHEHDRPWTHRRFW